MNANTYRTRVAATKVPTVCGGNGKRCTTATLCRYRGNDAGVLNTQKQLCQGHGGNLFEHSQWAALQIVVWLKKGEPMVKEYLDNFHEHSGRRQKQFDLLLLAGFLHDVGKAGDCIFDMYSKHKYHGDEKGDAVHPQHCGEMLLGHTAFHYGCGRKAKGQMVQKFKIRPKIKSWFPQHRFTRRDLNTLALAAFMHWEFGRLNIEKREWGQITNEEYVTTFKAECARCNLAPTTELLQMCIIVSCTDISAGTNVRLKEQRKVLVNAFGGAKRFQIGEEAYLSKNMWVLKEMDKNYERLRKALIKHWQNSGKPVPQQPRHPLPAVAPLAPHPHGRGRPCKALLPRRLAPTLRQVRHRAVAHHVVPGRLAEVARQQRALLPHRPRVLPGPAAQHHVRRRPVLQVKPHVVGRRPRHQGVVVLRVAPYTDRHAPLGAHKRPNVKCLVRRAFMGCCMYFLRVPKGRLCLVISVCSCAGAP